MLMDTLAAQAQLVQSDLLEKMAILVVQVFYGCFLCPFNWKLLLDFKLF